MWVIASIFDSSPDWWFALAIAFGCAFVHVNRKREKLESKWEKEYGKDKPFWIYPMTLGLHIIFYMVVINIIYLGILGQEYDYMK